MKYYEICCVYGKFILQETAESGIKNYLKDDILFYGCEKGLTDGFVTEHIVYLLKKICPEKIALLTDINGKEIINNGI